MGWRYFSNLSLRIKYAAVGGAVVLLLSVGLTWAFISQTNRWLIQNLQEKGLSKVEELAAGAVPALVNVDGEGLDQLIEETFRAAEVTYVAFLDSRGEILASRLRRQRLGEVPRRVLEKAQEAVDPTSISFANPDGQTIYFFVTPVIDTEGATQSRLGAVILGFSSYFIQRGIGEIIKITLPIFIGALVVSCLLFVFLIEKSLHPLQDLVQLTSKIARGDFSQRIEVRKQDEIGQLTNSFNEMADALQKRKAEVEQWAHEQAALNAIAMATSQSLQIDAVLQIALDKILEVMGRDVGFIRLKDDLTGRLTLVAHRGLSESYVASLEKEGRIGWMAAKVLATGELLTINDPSPGDLLEESWREGIRATIWVPIQTHGQVVGVLTVASRTARPFETQDVGLLKAISNIVGTAVANARLYEETRQRAEKLEAFNELAHLITSSLSTQKVFDFVVRSAAKFVNAKMVRLWAEDQTSGSFVVRASCGIEQPLLQQHTAVAAIRPGQGVVGGIIESKTAEYIRDVREDPRWLNRSMLVALGLVSFAGVPIVMGDRVLGVLTIMTDHPHEFSGEEKDLLKGLADQAAVAIGNAMLFEETERRAQEQAILNAIAMATSQSLHLDELLQISLDRVLDVMGRDQGYIRLKDPVTGKLRLSAHRGISKEYIEVLLHRRTPGGKGDQVFESGEVLVINDPEKVSLKEETRREGRHSLIWVPLKARGKVVGLLNVTTSRPIPFAPREVELLQAIGNVIGVAIENVRLFQETEQRARQQEALNAIAMATAQLLDLKELFEIALDKTVEVTGRQRINIRLKDPLTGKANMVAYRGFTEEEVEELHRRTPHHPMSEQVLASGNPLIVNDTGENHSLALLKQTRSVAWIPIKAGARVVGVLGISDDQSRPFLPSEVDLLQAIGSVIGVAIENARLFDETKRNLERIRALREIDRAITSTLDLRTVLEVLLEKIDLVLPYSATTVRLLNKESGAIEPVACRNLDEKEWKAERWRGGRGIPNVVFETKAPVTISNVQSDPQNRDQEFFRKHGLVSYLGVPLIVQDEVLGVISFYTKGEHDFSNEEVEFLATLAGQAAIAIHNSQLYQEMIKLAADLSRSNKVKDEFLSVMSHELRTPLNVVMGYAGMIRDRMLGEINPEQEKALDKVVNRAREQLTMISSILQAVQMEAEGVKMERREVRLEDLLDDLKSSYSIPFGKELSLVWDYPSHLPVVKTDGEKLKHILQNLINNAVKFTEKGRVTISARCLNGARQGSRQESLILAPSASSLSPSWVEFKVADTGIGIAEEYFSLIFERFHQVDSSETRRFGGVGIGLYIVKMFTELLGGKVEVESQPGKGSTFTVVIPCESHPLEISSRESVAQSSESV